MSWLTARQLPLPALTFGPLALAAGIASGLLTVVGVSMMQMPLLPLLLPAGIAFLLLTLHRTEYSILLAVALTNGLLDPDALPIFNFGPLGVSIPELILVCLLGLAFLRVMARADHRIFPSPLALPLLFFLLMVAISSVNAYLYGEVSLGLIIPQLRNYAFWTLFFAVTHLITRAHQIERMTTGLWILTAILGIGALLPGLFNHTPFMNSATPTLATADRAFEGVTRLFFSGERFLYVMIPVSVAWLALVRDRRTGPVLVIFVLLLGWLFFSFQRNYWVTIALSLGLMGLLLLGESLWRMLRRMLPLFLMAAIALMALQVTQPQLVRNQIQAAAYRLLSLVNDPGKTDSSTQWRLIENRHAFDALSAHPLTGIGIAETYRPRMVDELETPLDWYIHNAYLWIAVKTGLVNLMIFLLFCSLYLLRVLRHWKHIKRDDMRALVLGFGMAFFGQMISNLVAPNFIQSPSLSIYPLMIGLSEVIIRLNPSRQMSPQGARYV